MYYMRCMYSFEKLQHKKHTSARNFKFSIKLKYWKEVNFFKSNKGEIYHLLAFNIFKINLCSDFFFESYSICHILNWKVKSFSFAFITNAHSAFYKKKYLFNQLFVSNNKTYCDLVELRKREMDSQRCIFILNKH